MSRVWSAATWFAVAFWAAALWPAAPWAAAQDSILTEAEFIAAVTARGELETVLSAGRSLAEAEVRAARLWPNPALGVSREAPGEVVETTVALSWAPPSPGRRDLERQVATHGLEAAGLRLVAARTGLRVELAAVYARWAVAEQRRQWLAAHRDPLEALADAARARAQAGEISGLTARRLELEAVAAAADVALAEAELVSARGTVASWWPALPAAARPVVPELPPQPPALPRLPPRPDLLALEREVARAETQLALSKKVFSLPEVELGWKRVEERNTSDSGAVLGLGWDLPLFNRRQEERAEAEARLAAAKADLELSRHRAATELEAALATYRTLHQRAKQTRAAAADLAALAASAEAAYRAGEGDVTDLLDSLRAVSATRLAALDAWAEALAAAHALTLALGTPLSPSTGDLP